MTLKKFKGFYLTLLLALIILFLSLKSPSEVDTKLLVSDKVLHLFAYFLMVLPVSLERNSLISQSSFLLWLMEDLLSLSSHLREGSQI